MNKNELKEKLFPLIKERVELREDVNSDNRRNKVAGLTGNKIFQKTFSKVLVDVTFEQALHIINNNFETYLEWLDEYPIEMLLISKGKPGYKKVSDYFNKGVFVDGEEWIAHGKVYRNKGTDYYLNKLK